MLVQRKWMYLESIFVGSDDIRQQLPQVRLARGWPCWVAEVQAARNCQATGRAVSLG